MSSLTIGDFDSRTRNLPITEGVTIENTLPPEMLVMILSHVRGADAMAAARVNRRWRAISCYDLLSNRVEAIMIIMASAMEARRLEAQQGRTVAFSRAYGIEEKCRGVFLDVSGALFKKEREDLSTRHLQTLIEVANKSSLHKNDLFGLIAAGALRGGKFNEARQAITLIKDRGFSTSTRGPYFEDLGKALIEFNKIHTKEDGAEEDRVIGDILHDFDSPVYKDQVHLSIAKALARVGSFELAAVHASLARLRSFEKDIALAEIAKLAAKVGRFDIARAEAEDISEYSYKDVTFKLISIEAAKSGNFEAAVEFIGFITDFGWKERACEVAAEKATKVGDFKAAIVFISLMPCDWEKEQACEEAGKEAVKAGDFKAAIEFVGLITESYRKERICEEAVKEAVKAGDFKAAIEFVGLITESYGRGHICEEAVKEATKVGDFKAAIEFVGFITCRWSKEVACREFAKEVAKAGDIEVVLTSARAIGAGKYKLFHTFCYSAAREAAEAGKLALARQLTDEIDYRQIISCFTDKTQHYEYLVRSFVFQKTIDQIIESVDSLSDTSVIVTIIEVLMDAYPTRFLDAEKIVESLSAGPEKDAALKYLIERLVKYMPRRAKLVLEKNRELFTDKSVEKQCEAIVKANLPWEISYLNIFIFMNLSVFVLSKLLDVQKDSE